ncbi:MAG TPA: outer membrane protein assembly factor BamE [Steroidobacteraceae bacterium]|nr:outer membrane protein assembly factor BamE [Steroidobacteraceae bacterium]
MKRLALLRLILLSSGALLASGCVYRMSIQQGNYLVTDSVSQLKEGMTRSQVRFLLGTPMVPDAFDNDRWDYYYYFNSRHNKEPLKRRLTVYFQDEKVQRYDNQGVPTQADLENIEAELKRARAEAKSKDDRGFWKKLFSRDDRPIQTEEAKGAKPTDEKPAVEKAPDPVPPAQPLPAPAGTPSGPT